MNVVFQDASGNSIGSEDQVAVGGKKAVSVSAAGALVKAGAGRLCRVLITTLGTAALLIYDANNVEGMTSGTIIGAIPASAAVGTVYAFDMPAQFGIYVPATTNAPTVTISYN